MAQLTLQEIAVRLANMIGLPYVWEDILGTIESGRPLPEYKYVRDKFYTSDKKDTSIICYGGPSSSPERCKIAYKRRMYHAYRRKSGMYSLLGVSGHLSAAQACCIVS